ncbi:MAG: cytochrome c [Deltaproteobacteria bacterium]|nr:cytochrome c [Deltaproteobacteria bacterium]
MSRAIVGCVAIVLAVLLIPSLALAQGNPAKGKDLYAKHCAGCHGPAGKGDGPAAAALTPKPNDLTDKAYMVKLKDQYLFDLIQKGGAAVGKSPLIPPFGSKLKEGEIRDVIAYLRSLAK